MTTAHRPTWAPAVGGEEQGGQRMFVPSKMRSAKDQSAHTKLKFRQDGQSSVADVAAMDLRADLEAKERKHAKKQGINFEEERQKDLLLLKEADADGQGLSKAPPRALIPKAMDADDEDEAESSSSSDDDDEDDEEDLLAELERIKKERAEDAAKKSAEDAVRTNKEKEQELRTGNPLLSIAGGAGGIDASFSVKRRWDDDVVFKHQTRGEPKGQKRFINDTIRNDFHVRFLNKYVR